MNFTKVYYRSNTIPLEKGEYYREIIDFNKIYAVTNFGKVWSYKKNRFLTIGKNTASNDLYVTLYFKSYTKSISIKRLVAEAFVSNPRKYFYIKFNDGNKYNCKYNNLEWIAIKKGNSNKGVLTKVTYIDEYNNKNVKTFNSIVSTAAFIKISNTCAYNWLRSNKWHEHDGIKYFIEKLKL